MIGSSPYPATSKWKPSKHRFIKKLDTMEQITEQNLVELGFQSMGMVCRKSLNTYLELCWFKHGEMRLQTVDSGFTILLRHIQTIEDVKDFWRLHTGDHLETMEEFMERNGLGDEDMINDITYPSGN